MRLHDAPQRPRPISHCSSSLQRDKANYSSSTCEFHGAKTVDDRVNPDVIPEYDPYSESFVNKSMASGKAKSYYPTFDRHVENGEQIKIEFEPSTCYLHEVFKFKVNHASVRDKVQSYNEATSFWDADKYLRNCHGKDRPSDKQRQGRKLLVAAYYEKMTKQHQKVSPTRSNRPRIIPTYVIPSEQKRDKIRFNIRMKMIRSSGIDFKSPDRSRKRSPNASTQRVTGKVTSQPDGKLQIHVKPTQTPASLQATKLMD